MFDLNAHLHHQFAWSRETFGPPKGAYGVIDHLFQELHEVHAEPEDLTEWIDIMILAFDGAYRVGYSPEDIIAALVSKQATNEQRKWPDWRTAEPGRAINHIKEISDG